VLRIIAVKRAPAHAGGLRTSERLAFVMVFSLMAAFVVGLTVLAAKTGAAPVIGGTTAAGAGTPGPASQGVAPGTSHSGGGKAGGDQCGGGQSGTGRAGLGHTPTVVMGTGTVVIRAASATLSTQLAASLRAAVGGRPGRLSVGVIDATTGATAWYYAGRQYDTAGIVKVDILAALLYLDQRAGRRVTRTDAGLAAEMIHDSSDTAAARLWQAIGGRGMAVANEALLLRHTTLGPAGSWGMTRSTAADQLQLLEDLTAEKSALHSGARGYAVALLADGVAGQRWGVAAAASPATAYAVTDGCRPDPRLWLADSIGVIQRDGHELLIAVLSAGNRTQAEGTRVVRAAVMAAAKVIMAAGSLSGERPGLDPEGGHFSLGSPAGGRLACRPGCCRSWQRTYADRGKSCCSPSRPPTCLQPTWATCCTRTRPGITRQS
jgi:hypothetical protein